MRDKKPIMLGAGIGIGAIQAYITREYLNYPIPIISDYLGTWGTTATLGNILVGGIIFGISHFTELIKSYNINILAKTYGLVAIAGGIINGVFPSVLGLTRVATLSYGRNGYIAHEYYPSFTGTFIDRPASRARGFGSDVTRNPMAAIPTTIPYNKILF